MMEIHEEIVTATDLHSLYSSDPILNNLRRPAATIATTRTTISSNMISPVRSLRRNAHIRLVPHLEHSHRCFVFDVVNRILEQEVFKLGRHSDRTVFRDRISFASKVVSRFHAELWLSKHDGKIYIKDTGSSTGTYVNHVRLLEDVPQEVVDGDLIQLGTNYKDGHDLKYRAVIIRLEVDRHPFTLNHFHIDAFKKLLAQQNTQVQVCCICLYCVAPSQALFVAPCSHMYHYRCLRPLLTQHYPEFPCPVCKTRSNLETHTED